MTAQLYTPVYIWLSACIYRIKHQDVERICKRNFLMISTLWQSFLLEMWFWKFSRYLTYVTRNWYTHFSFYLKMSSHVRCSQTKSKNSFIILNQYRYIHETYEFIFSQLLFYLKTEEKGWNFFLDKEHTRRHRVMQHKYMCKMKGNVQYISLNPIKQM